MKHWSVKLIALILVIASAFSLAVCGITVIYNVNRDMYGEVSLEERQNELIDEVLEYYCSNAANLAAAQYLMELNTDEFSVNRELWRQYFDSYIYLETLWPECEYTISYNEAAGVPGTSTAKADVTYASTRTVEVYAQNGMVTRLGSALREYPDYDNLPLDYVWTDQLGNELPGLDDRTVYYDIEQVGQIAYRVERFEDVKLQVEILLTEADLSALMLEVDEIALMQVAYAVREYDISVVIVSTLVLLGSMLYLCCVSGKKPDGEIAPRGLNRMPLDLYACATFAGVMLTGAGGVICFERFSWSHAVEDILIWLGLFGGCAALMVLTVTLFLMAFCAQVRMGGGAWYKRTLLGRFGKGIWNLCRKIVFWFWNKAKTLWNWACEKLNLLNYLRIFGQVLKKLWGMLDLVWQWVILYGGLLLLTVWVADTFMYHNGWAFFVVAVFGFPLVAYTAFAFGKLRSAAKQMRDGDLSSKIDPYEELLFGHFAEFAEDLNTLSDTCIDAAMAKMKSERMKTELITNVSHDIKTPLTSIINYVDLLKTAETEEARREYLEVLDRQSLRLKKLIEDLMEMSKASTGNITAELAPTDVVEAVNQALGEFADRLNALELNIVFRQADQSITANCDGKLLWRVLSNLLVNVVKYTLPGTRVYVDVTEDERKVCISLKNISREPLNIPASELMERFVRGDESRTDQGNGLGLNIAQSLMEVQNGTLDLTVDGDLFKVTLTLNK